MLSLKRPLLTPPILWGFAALSTIGIALIPTGIFQREIVNFDGWPQLWRFLIASIQPDLSQEIVQVTIEAALVTLSYAVCGTFLTVLIGAFFGVLSSEVWWHSIARNTQRSHPLRQGYWVSRLVLAIPRSIHELIWGLFFLNIWGLDPIVAIVAIAIPFGAITAKVFSEILDDTPRQPLEALLRSGVSPLTAFFYSLFPQAFLNLLSYSFYRFECALRSAAVLGVIGAGGLGYQILLSVQSLKYNELWTFFDALLILNGVVDLASAGLRNRLGCASRLDLNLKKGQRSQQKRLHPAFTSDTSLHHSSPRALPHIFSRRLDLLPFQVDRLITHPISLLCLGGGLIAYCFWYVHPDLSRLTSERSQRLLTEVTRSLFPPDFSILPTLIPQAVDTLAMAILAIAFAAGGGLLLAFPAAHNFFLPGGLFNPGQNTHFLASIGLWASRFLLLLSRAIPAPIWALVILYVLFPGILPGAIALGIHNLGILGRLMAEVIENLDQKPLQALRSTGASSNLVFLYGILPLTTPRFLAYSLYRWEVCMRETVIVGLVGAGGLGQSLTEQLSSFDYRSLVVTLGIFLILTFGVDGISSLARRSLR